MEPASQSETTANMPNINSSTSVNSTSTDLKRKRSPSNDHPPQTSSAAPPPPKNPKTSNHLQINYLARQYDADLPLVSNDDTLPSILALLGEYQGVLERHESMAGNLGARPLGPILIKRFERIFDGPPKVLKSHGKEGTTVTWLDVVEFARNKPEQFTLAQMSEGLRVCQFYTKQCRVQISEEDFVLIESGIPQKMIPPQPIIEDEEKELGTLEILEKNLAQICQLADQVAARTRQLNHRLKARKTAILDRRASGAAVPAARATSPSNVALMNGAGVPVSQPSSSQPGFVAVNSRQHGADANGVLDKNGASPATHQDLRSKFFTLSERRGGSNPASHHEIRRSANTHGSVSTSTPSRGESGKQRTVQQTVRDTDPSHPHADADHAVFLGSTTSPAPHRTSGTPQYSATVLTDQANPTRDPLIRPIHPIPVRHSHSHEREKDDGGPYRAEMISRMETLAKGERVLPPCDRCRRLHMDCLKNLTACMGCTKKHAKCSWKEVKEGELGVRPEIAHSAQVAEMGRAAAKAQLVAEGYDISEYPVQNPLEGYRHADATTTDEEKMEGVESSHSHNGTAPRGVSEDSVEIQLLRSAGIEVVNANNARNTPGSGGGQEVRMLDSPTPAVIATMARSESGMEDVNMMEDRERERVLERGLEREPSVSRAMGSPEKVASGLTMNEAGSQGDREREMREGMGFRESLGTMVA